MSLGASCDLPHMTTTPTAAATADETSPALTCDGWCNGGPIESVGYIDESGFAYCGPCGQRRQQGGHKRCRKLRPHELTRLQSGRPLKEY